MSKTSKTVLIVDDEPDVRAMVAGILQQEGWDTIEGQNAEEAIALARQSQPDVMILDIMMPGKDGFEVYKEIRADGQTAHIPVVMLTAISERELGASYTAEAIGARLGVPAPQAFIDKPVDRNRIREAVRKAMGN